jgi:hypothetical protein
MATLFTNEEFEILEINGAVFLHALDHDNQYIKVTTSEKTKYGIWFTYLKQLPKPKIQVQPLLAKPKSIQVQPLPKNDRLP